MFAESDIKVGDVIGEGHFGVAYKARIKGKKVVLKVPKDSSSKTGRNDFMRHAITCASKMSYV